MKMKMTKKIIIHLRMKKITENWIEEEEANDEFSESSSSTDYDHLEQERIR